MSDAINKRSTLGSIEAAKDDMVNRVRNSAANAQKEASEFSDDVVRGASTMAGNVSSTLKSVGVDTDVMVSAAKDQASELQRILGDELKSHPLRALGIAAAVGVIVGLLSAR